jgi:hypothetical protein
MTIVVREHSHTTVTGIGKPLVYADMVNLQTSEKNTAEGTNMKTKMKPKSTAELLRAQIRLGMIARMIRVNIEESPTEEEFPEVMETIIAACGVEDNK